MVGQGGAPPRDVTPAPANPVAPAVSVVVPCRNEVAHIDALLRCLEQQAAPEGGFEIIVSDGSSDDGTGGRLREWSRALPHLQIIDNPERIVSTALNRAVDAARGEIIVRMDAHTEYAPDYIRECVAALTASGADNAGGPWRARGSGYLQKAIALAFQSRFASGGAASHAVDHEGEVDTVYLGCWRKETLRRLGGFDEELIRNQDDELNLRITRGGGRVWQTPRVRSWYHPRASLRALFTQYAQYGYWKVRVIQKHRIPASARHLVPGAFVGGLIGLTVLTPAGPAFRRAWLALVGLYATANLAAAITVSRGSERRRFLPVMPLVFVAYHIGYGYGFLRGVLDFVVLRRRGAATFGRLTRGASRP